MLIVSLTKYIFVPFFFSGASVQQVSQSILTFQTFDLEIDNLFLDEPEVVNCNGDAYITRECVQVNF